MNKANPLPGRYLEDEEDDEEDAGSDEDEEYDEEEAAADENEENGVAGWCHLPGRTP